MAQCNATGVSRARKPSKAPHGSICWNGVGWPVHRAMWTAQRGPIPTDDDWTIDHLCRNRACVNVDHLEVVTRWENSRRGGGLELAHQANRDKPACKHGHPFTPDNIWWTKQGHRICKACKKAYWPLRKKGARKASDDEPKPKAS